MVLDFNKKSWITQSHVKFKQDYLTASINLKTNIYISSKSHRNLNSLHYHSFSAVSAFLLTQFHLNLPIPGTIFVETSGWCSQFCSQAYACILYSSVLTLSISYPCPCTSYFYCNKVSRNFSSYPLTCTITHTHAWWWRCGGKKIM